MMKGSTVKQENLYLFNTLPNPYVCSSFLFSYSSLCITGSMINHRTPDAYKEKRTWGHNYQGYPSSHLRVVSGTGVLIPVSFLSLKDTGGSPASQPQLAV